MEDRSYVGARAELKNVVAVGRSRLPSVISIQTFHPFQKARWHPGRCHQATESFSTTEIKYEIYSLQGKH